MRSVDTNTKGKSGICFPSGCIFKQMYPSVIFRAKENGKGLDGVHFFEAIKKPNFKDITNSKKSKFSNSSFYSLTPGDSGK